ncbi:hypothetical protein GOV10_04105 [Candidatus Woesearchaeota archaeon]|nr:hypothetical protein [Candidatus Woesearchaeota archaeon]
MAWKKHLREADVVLAIIGLLLFSFVPPYIICGLFFFITPFYLLTTGRAFLLKDFCLATILGFGMTFVFSSFYTYQPAFFGISLFPLFAWPLGLFTTKLFHEEWAPKKYSLLSFLIIYWGLLLFEEIVGYHFLGIQNIGTALYAGLPFCNCLHAPWFMQLTYLLMGPLYFFILTLVKKYSNSKRV